MTEHQYLTVKVTGPPESLAEFVDLCVRIDQLCSLGASRTIQCDVDGDGSAGLRFDFGTLDISKVKEAASADDYGWTNDDVYRCGIGG